jgi:hypothetical protein
MSSRTDRRKNYPPETRIQLLEEDVDKRELVTDRLEEELDRNINILHSEIKGMRQILISVLVTTTVAALIFALNVIVKSIG